MIYFLCSYKHHTTKFKGCKMDNKQESLQFKIFMDGVNLSLSSLALRYVKVFISHFK